MRWWRDATMCAAAVSLSFLLLFPPVGAWAVVRAVDRLLLLPSLSLLFSTKYINIYIYMLHIYCRQIIVSFCFISFRRCCSCFSLLVHPAPLSLSPPLFLFLVLYSFPRSVFSAISALFAFPIDGALVSLVFQLRWSPYRRLRYATLRYPALPCPALRCFTPTRDLPPRVCMHCVPLPCFACAPPYASFSSAVLASLLVPLSFVGSAVCLFGSWCGAACARR